MELGYALSSEEHGARDLVRYAAGAERAGFAFALISDHFHPWIDRQGQSPFVWGVLGAIAERTERIRVGTGVTCPTMRVHPAIVAQAAATAASLLPHRFFLGVGSGENLNEHIMGSGWPAADVRLEMLEEAVEVIRRLWSGQPTTHRGRHFTLEEARLYSLPECAPKIAVAAKGLHAAALAGRIGDALVSASPDASVVDAFDAAGGGGKPRYGQLHVCWADTEEDARKIVLDRWPNSALPGDLDTELPLPRHFEQASSILSDAAIADAVLCGPDPERHLAAIREFEDAGFDHVYVHQVGSDQLGFFDFYRSEVMPKLG
ncbi:MAG TPA: TIGR03557 family F420-dependent LLM class oxidoreductase [Actinomycetota bacterium]|jgi:G6PDH family F420-dependent oxidoreductase